jgi:hypothetical protein
VSYATGLAVVDLVGGAVERCIDLGGKGMGGKLQAQ